MLWWFKMPQARDGNGNESPQLVQRFRKIGANLFVEVRVPWAWLQSAVYPIVIDPTIDDSVDTGIDDGYSETKFSTFNRLGSTIFVGEEDAASLTDAGSFFLFGTISDLSGVTIDVANVTPTIASHVGTATKANVYAEDAASPTSYTSFSEHRDATRTTAFVAWDDETGTEDQQSPSIVSVIQELADSYDPSAIMILLDNDGSADGNRWTIRAYEGLAAWGADLHIEYTAAGFIGPFPTHLRL
jgi:hypothetical protein